MKGPATLLKKSRGTDCMMCAMRKKTRPIRHSSYLRPTLVVFALATVSACATAQSSKPVVEFPSAQAMAELESHPAVLPSISAGEVPKEGWKVESPEAVTVLGSDWEPQGDWEKAFATEVSAARHNLRMTRAMSCASREIGRYYLERKLPPPEVLKKFMLAACGAVVPDAGVQWLEGDVPEQATDAEVQSRWQNQIKSRLVAQMPANTTEGGFWYGRAHGRAVAVATFASPAARLTTLALVPDAKGYVTLEGELRQPADYVVGYANQGIFGVQRCAMDPSVARPRFRARCHIADGDDTAWVQLLAAAPRRVLAVPFIQILVRRAADQPPTFQLAPYANSRMVSNPTEFASALFEGLNAVRAQAGLRRVQIAASESTSATRLAGHFFSAVLKSGIGAESDHIALGLLAGWQTGGTIRDALLVANLAPRTHDAGQWLSGALAMPIGRATLLAEDIEEVAVGPVMFSDPDGLAALVSGYRYYHDDDHSADVSRLYERLLTARERLGLQLPQRLAHMDRVLRAELSRVQAGESEPMDALQASLNEGVGRFGAGMKGFVIETTSLEAFEIPEDIVKRRNLYLEIGVGHHRPPGAAWGQMVIVVVYADLDAGRIRQSI